MASYHVASANPFGLLATKRMKGDPTKHAATKASSTPATRNDNVIKAPVDQGPAKKSRVISLTSAPAAATEEKEVPQTKADRETKDRHLDRSAKRDHTRKGGAGVGGWEDSATKPEDAENAEAAAAIAEGDDEGAEGASPVQPKTGGAEAAEEEEKPTFTLAQYEAERAKRKPQLTTSTRQVDTSAFKNMTQMKSTEEDNFFQVAKKPQEQKKQPEAKPVPQGKAGKKGAAPVVEAPKKVDNHPKQKKVDKEASASIELGFRMNPFEGQRGRGGRGGRGRGEGRGFGRGRGRFADAEGAAPATETAEGETPAATPAAEGETPAEGATAATTTTTTTTEASPVAPAEGAATTTESRPEGRGRGFGRGEGRGRRGDGEGRGYRGDGEGRGYGRGGRGGYDRDREGGRPFGRGRGEGRGDGEGRGYRGDGEGRGFGRGRGGFQGGRGRRDEPRQPNVESEVDFPKLGGK